MGNDALNPKNALKTFTTNPLKDPVGYVKNAAMNPLLVAASPLVLAKAGLDKLDPLGTKKLDALRKQQEDAANKALEDAKARDKKLQEDLANETATSQGNTARNNALARFKAGVVGQGRSGTILTGPLGVSSDPTLATKTLLGS